MRGDRAALDRAAHAIKAADAESVIKGELC